MRRSPVLDPHGNPVFTFGGQDSWKQFHHRGYTISIEWAISDTNRRTPPVMAIWASHALIAQPSARDGTWVITRNALGDFVGFNRDDKCTGGASMHCMREAQAALPLLGKDKNDRQAFTALVDCVVKHAEHLVHCPPTPMWLQRQQQTAPMWEVTATNKATGQVLHEAEV